MAVFPGFENGLVDLANGADNLAFRVFAGFCVAETGVEAA